MSDTELRTPAAESLDEALRAADAAARAAQVEVREVFEIADLDAVGWLFEQIWQREAAAPITTELLRALAQAGNYVVGAFSGATLVGGCVGFFSAPADGSMHSHIAGVSASVRHRHVGLALKLHQRAWALRRGVSVVAWTFDPLVARNAYLNLAKLAAEPVAYLPNFYGGMHDGINGDDETDRLLVHWELTAPQVVAACAGDRRVADAVAERDRGAVVALGISPQGHPVPGALDAPTSLVAVPPDISALRSTDPGLAREWRAAVRAALGPLLAGGARVAGFDRAGWYVLRQDDPVAGSSGGPQESLHASPRAEGVQA